MFAPNLMPDSFELDHTPLLTRPMHISSPSSPFYTIASSSMSFDSDIDVDGEQGHKPRQPRPKNRPFGRNQRSSCFSDVRSENGDDEDTSDSLDCADSGFYDRSPPSTNTSITPPRADEIDRWQRHTTLELFRQQLQRAANSVFPNNTQSRYKNVYVLMIRWEKEDPKLPVSLELNALQRIFEDTYCYEVEIFLIPDKRSHAKVSKKINDFVDINDDSKDDLKIIYYGGHSSLSKTKELVWSNLWNPDNDQCATVTWTGIQRSLEQAESDALILLDCCFAGLAGTGAGNGVTELMSASAYDVRANGVGYFSFSQALIIELELLSRKPSFSVGELYENVYRRCQHHLPRGVAREHYPAPVHLPLTKDKGYPRSLHLSIHRKQSDAEFHQLVECPLQEATNTKKRPVEDDPWDMTCKRPCVSSGFGVSEGTELWMSPSLSAGDGINSQNSVAPILSALDADDGSGSNAASSDSLHTSLNSLEPDSKGRISKEQSVRVLLAIRLEENADPKDMAAKDFTEWFRTLPAPVKGVEVKVEAAFACNSTLVLVSLPLSLWTYLPQHPAVTSLGTIKSSNFLSTLQTCRVPCPTASEFRNHSVRDQNRKGKHVSFAIDDILFNVKADDKNENLQDNVAPILGSLSQESNPDQYACQARTTEPEFSEVHCSLERETLEDSTFEVSGPAKAYVSNILDKFPSADIRLIQRLGEANWQRHVIIRNKQDQEEPGQSILQRTAKSIFHPALTFHDSGIGSSLPVVSAYAPSLSSFVSKLDDADNKYFRVPPTPKEVLEGKPFECFICDRTISTLKNRADWKLHVYTDIRPYICTLSSCKDALCTFATRHEWADHESKHYPPRISFTCPLCQQSLAAGRKVYVSHVARHMESISLAALPRSVDEDSEEGSNASNDALPQEEERIADERSIASPAGSQDAPSDATFLKHAFPTKYDQNPREARGQELCPQIQHNNGSLDIGQAQQMVPPEIKIEFAPASIRNSSEPPKPSFDQDPLTPPDRGRRRRAVSDQWLFPDGSRPQPPPLSPGEYADSGNTKRVPKHPATFQCTLCPKRFVRAYNLHSHLRTHTEERPFLCKVCGKGFARQHDKKRHEGLHTAEKKFVCKGELKEGGLWGCGRRYARADALGRHFRSGAGRICIKPLLDEEAIERQRLWQEQRIHNLYMQQPQPISLDANSFPINASGDYTVPAALLAQYPALATLSWSEMPQGDAGIDDGGKRSNLDASGLEHYEEDESGHMSSGAGQQQGY